MPHAIPPPQGHPGKVLCVFVLSVEKRPHVVLRVLDGILSYLVPLDCCVRDVVRGHELPCKYSKEVRLR